MPKVTVPREARRPKGYDEIVRRRTDLSFFLVHLTKDGPDVSAPDRLTNILTKDQEGYCTLKGTPQGFFSKLNTVTDDPDLIELTRGVALTEAPLDQIKHFATPMNAAGRQYSRFGLVFEQDFIRRARGNPCFYVSTWPDLQRRTTLFALISDSHLKQAAYRDLLLYFNIFGQGSAEKPLDFYWEREWRVPGDLRFRHDDVFVGLAPSEADDRGNYWVKYLQGRFPAVPFIDPEWSNDEILRALREATRPRV